MNTPEDPISETYQDYINQNSDAKFSFAIQWLPLFICEQCGVDSPQYKAILAFLDTISVGPSNDRNFLPTLLSPQFLVKLPKDHI
jgi:hypothetical protein